MLRRLFSLLTLGLTLAATANAVPVQFGGTVSGPVSNYTLIHGCAIPSGCPGADPLRNWFVGGQSISGTADFDAGSLSVSGQSYMTFGGVTFYLNELIVDFDTVTGRVLNGHMDYTYGGVSSTFAIGDPSMGLWNSIVLPDLDGNFGGYFWAGDPSWNGAPNPYCNDDVQNPMYCGIGIDFVFSGKIPEPGTLALLGLGLLALAFFPRRKTHD